jgi:hypothetical protein
LVQNFFKNNETNSTCFVLVSIEKSEKVIEDLTTTKTTFKSFKKVQK